MPESQVRAELLPAQGQSSVDLVLLHGWAGSSDCWRSLVAPVRAWANVTLVSWRPGTATGAWEALLDGILAVAPPRAIYVGWSLGGQVATALAAQAPQRVAGLVTVACNPHFTAAGNWPGVVPAELAAFQAGLAADAVRTLRRFAALQCRGCSGERALARQLVAQSEGWTAPALAVGLQWLAELDTRNLLPALACPQQHLLAQHDALVPGGTSEALTGLLASATCASVRVLPDTCHALPVAAPAALASALHTFAGASADTPPAPVRIPVSKQAIALSFSRAAPRYDSVAALQRDVGERLLRDMPSSGKAPCTVLDLGCGTGFFQPHLLERYPRAAYLGLDLAQGMLAWAREHQAQGTAWVAGDAEALPLAPRSIDVIFSSLAFQWCYRPDLLFAELARVLAPGGGCFFSSLGPATLQELRLSWAAADGGQHVNDFLPAAALQAVAAVIPGVRLSLRSERIVLRYSKVAELLHELKTLGAHNMHSERPAGLTGRQRLAAMMQAYEDWREPEGLPATYDVIYGYLEKT